MDVEGRIFDVKRFAVHDGPGVRTTLFLKGCPLRCRWCHNPEGMEPRPQLAFFERKCLACGECVKACRRGAHELVEGRRAFLRERCAACGACVERCLGGALRLFGRKLALKEALEIVLEDLDFYMDGGGVTVSGGEPLLQADFCASLFRSLKREGVHCAVDTSGAVQWESFEKVLPFADIFLYDVKHVDDALHVKLTGMSNEIILRNLELLSERGVPIEIRIPCVPGFNLDDDSMKAIGGFLDGMKNIMGVRLLPYHAAISKREALGLLDPMEGIEPPSAESMLAFAAILKGFRLPLK